MKTIVAFLILLAAVTAPAQVLVGIPAPTVACTDRVAATALSMSPQAPLAGTTAVLTFSFRNACSSGAAVSIPWRIAMDNVVLGTGTYANVSPGQTVTVSVKWTAKLGPHHIYADADPDNSLNEALSYRGNNLPAPIDLTVNADWAAVRERTKTAMRQAVPQWTLLAAFKDVLLNVEYAYGGRLTASDLSKFLHPALTANGVPEELASPLAAALSESWKKWSDSVTVNGPFWFDLQSCAPTSSHPPTPNRPTPLGTMFQNPAPLLSGNLAAAMRGRLGAFATYPGADAAISEIGTWIGECFPKYAMSVQVDRVMASPVVPLPGCTTLLGAKANQEPYAMTGQFCP